MGCLSAVKFVSIGGDSPSESIFVYYKYAYPRIYEAAKIYFPLAGCSLIRITRDMLSDQSGSNSMKCFYS